MTVSLKGKALAHSEAQKRRKGEQKEEWLALAIPALVIILWVIILIALHLMGVINIGMTLSSFLSTLQ